MIELFVFFDLKYLTFQNTKLAFYIADRINVRIHIVLLNAENSKRENIESFEQYLHNYQKKYNILILRSDVDHFLQDLVLMNADILIFDDGIFGYDNKVPEDKKDLLLQINDRFQGFVFLPGNGLSTIAGQNDIAFISTPENLKTRSFNYLKLTAKIYDATIHLLLHTYYNKLVLYKPVIDKIYNYAKHYGLPDFTLNIYRKKGIHEQVKTFSKRQKVNIIGSNASSVKMQKDFVKAMKKTQKSLALHSIFMI